MIRLAGADGPTPPRAGFVSTCDIVTEYGLEREKLHGSVTGALQIRFGAFVSEAGGGAPLVGKPPVAPGVGPGSEADAERLRSQTCTDTRISIYHRASTYRGSADCQAEVAVGFVSQNSFSLVPRCGTG